MWVGVREGGGDSFSKMVYMVLMEGCLAGVDDLLEQYYTVGGHYDDKNAGYCCARCTVLLCCRLFIVQKLIPQTGLFRCNVKWWIATAAATTL